MMIYVVITLNLKTSLTALMTKTTTLTDEIYDFILQEYKELGYELFDEMFLTQFTYVGGYQHQNL